MDEKKWVQIGERAPTFGDLDLNDLEDVEDTTQIPSDTQINGVLRT